MSMTGHPAKLRQCVGGQGVPNARNLHAGTHFLGTSGTLP